MSDAGRTRASFAVACAALLVAAGSGDGGRSVAPRPAGVPVVAVLLTGPSAAELDALGILGRLGRSPLGSEHWAAGELIEIPGAHGPDLWARVRTSRIRPGPGDADVLAAGDVAVLGGLDAPADAAEDERRLAGARAALRGGDRAPSAAPPAVLVGLGCAHPAAAGLGSAACRRRVLEAIELAEEVAAGGGVGLVATVPWSGFPAIGTLWVAGAPIRPLREVRFRTIDVAPTVLRLNGRALPLGIDGAPGHELLRREAAFHLPARWQGGGM